VLAERERRHLAWPRLWLSQLNGSTPGEMRAARPYLSDAAPARCGVLSTVGAFRLTGGGRGGVMGAAGAGLIRAGGELFGARAGDINMSFGDAEMS
jgi:hypothetical protein